MLEPLERDGARSEPRTVALGVLTAILRGAERRGVDGRVLCSNLGLPTFAAKPPDARVALDTARSLLDEAATLARDPALPVVTGQALRCSDLGVFGFLLLTADTVPRLLEVVKYHPLISEQGSWCIEQDGEGIHVTFVTGEHQARADRIWIEAALTMFVSLLRDSCGPVAPVRACFRHTAPSNVSAHRRHFGCPLHFRADADSLLFRPEVGAMTPRLAEPAMFRYFAKHADAEIEALRQVTTLPDRVRRELLVELENGDASAARIAQRFGWTERTLRRRLEQHGTGFKELLAEARRGRAERLLGDEGRTLTEIGFALGYSETSAFSRAFRRMSGMTPAQFRRRAAARSAKC
jgi:AraC-like DNA-binding protein